MNCKSCGHSFKGTYCNHCGEKIIDQKDRQLRHFFGEVVAAFTFADNKFWRSVRLIIIQPGKLSYDISQGIRQKYMKLVSLFFLANFVYFLFPTFDVFTTNLHSQTHFFSYSEAANKLVEEHLERHAITFEDYEAAYNQKTAELSKIFLLLIVLMMSGFISLLHLGSRRLFADHLLVSLEFFSFMLIYTVIGFGTLIWMLVKTATFFGVDWSMLFEEEIILIVPVVIASFLYFFYRAERTFYQSKTSWAIMRSLGLIVAFYISLSCYRGLLFYLTYWSI